MTEYVWRPQPGPQKALIDCPVAEIFFGGARGGGKTDGIIGKLALRAREHGRHENQIIFRREMPAADDIISRGEEVFGALGAKWNGQDRIWRWPNGARTRVRPLERKADADKYQGQNLTCAVVEEAGQYADPAPIDRLHAVLRSAQGINTQLILTGNPGGPGQHWLRKRFVDPAPKGMTVLQRKLPGGMTLSYVYIPSRVADNRILMQEDPEYVARLHMVGSEQLVRAWLYGDWDAVEGAFFDCWDSQRHVVEPFTIPKHWTKFRSIDWGSAAPFSVGWWAVASDDTHAGVKIPRGCLVRYREWYGADEPNTGIKWPAEDVAKGILAREKEGEEIAYSVLDPSAFSQDGGPSIGEKFARMGVLCRPADNRRVGNKGHIGGWDEMRARMMADPSQLVVFSNCTEFIRTVPMLQHDDVRPEDLDTHSEDHVADEARYACMSRPYLGKEPVERDTSIRIPTFDELLKMQPRKSDRI